MPDFERADQILAISKVLTRLPTGNKTRPYMGTPPAILGMWATELHDKFGVRVHPDEATHELVRVKSPMGNHGPVQCVLKGTVPQVGPNPEAARMQSAHAVLMDWLREKDPVLADRVAKAQTNPTLAAIVLNDIRREHPEIEAKGQEILANTPTEVFEQ